MPKSCHLRTGLFSLGVLGLAKEKKMSTQTSEVLSHIPAVLRKSKSLGYYADYYVMDVVNGEMVRRRTRLTNLMNRYTTRREKILAAQNFIEELNRKLSGGWSPLHETENSRLYTPLTELRDTFLKRKSAEGVRDATLQSYSSITNLMVRWCEDSGRGRKVSGNFLRLDAVCYMDYILDKGNSNRSYNNTLKTLKVFWGWALEHCFCKENPFEGLKPLPKEKKRRILIDAASRARIADYFERECPQMLTVCLLVYSSAMRPKEIANIQIRDIDLERRCIVVRDEVAKNRKSRCATLTPALIARLKPIVNMELPGSYYLFGSNWRISPGEKRVALSNFRKKWDRVREELLLPVEMQLYSLRDTGITDLLHAGVDQLTVQHHADHSSLTMQNIYTDHFDAGLNEKIYSMAPEF